MGGGPLVPVLYDLPGPAAGSRSRGIGVVGVTVIVAALAFVLYRFWDAGQFTSRMWDWITYEAIQVRILDGL
ncbi:amino acid ABC transporter permease, partial [Microbacterium sp. HSID17254]